MVGNLHLEAGLAKANAILNKSSGDSNGNTDEENNVHGFGFKPSSFYSSTSPRPFGSNQSLNKVSTTPVRKPLYERSGSMGSRLSSESPSRLTYGLTSGLTSVKTPPSSSSTSASKADDNCSSTVIGPSLKFSYSVKRNNPKFVSPHEIGFPNLGLTCYLNSVLQALLGVPDFLRDLLDLNIRLKEIASPVKSNNVLRAFCRLALLKQRGHQAEISDALNSLKSALVRSNPQFEGIHMQDAHEFLISFCDTFERESLEALQQLKLPAKNLLEKIFGFKLEETKTCQICQHESSKVTTDFILKLVSPVHLSGFGERPEANRLTSLLKRTLNCKPEFICENCDKKENVVHKLSERFIQLPACLIFYLPRTRYFASEDEAAGLRYEKNREAVEFPEILALDEFMSANADPETLMASPMSDLRPAVKRRSSESSFSESPTKKSRNSFSSSPLTSPLTSNTEEERFSESVFNAQNLMKDLFPETPVVTYEVEPNLSTLWPARTSIFSVETTDGNSINRPIISMAAMATPPITPDSSPVSIQVSNEKPSALFPMPMYTVDTPKKLKNLTMEEIENLSEDDKLELATRQSLKESKCLSPLALNVSEDEQLQRAIQESLETSNLSMASFENNNNNNADDSISKIMADSCLSPMSTSSDEVSVSQDSRKSKTINFTPPKFVMPKYSPAKTTPAKTPPAKATPARSTPAKTTPIKTTPAKSALPVTSNFPTYQLIGVVSHLGGSATINSGHYVADVFNERTSQWFRYDDMNVTRRSKNDVINANARDAYLFIYRRQLHHDKQDEQQQQQQQQQQ